MDKKTTTPSAPGDAQENVQQDEKNYRLVPAMKVAQLERTMNGAEKRKIRLQTERAECRAIIRRKYTIVYDQDGNAIGRNQLSPEQVFGYRLKRTQIEKELATVNGNYLKARKAYRAAVSNNFQIERKSVQLIREENRIQRESKKLLHATMAILKEHGSNGGVKEFRHLRDLAVQGDVKAFRGGFDAVMEKFDPAHYTMISGVNQVKTEIMHAVMEQIVEEDQKKVDSLTSAVTTTSTNA